MDGRRDGRKAAPGAETRSRPAPRSARKPAPASPRKPPAAPLSSRPGGADPHVVELLSRRALLVAARQLLHERTDRCTKCGSSFITHEPAFVHCHYCGRMHRVANASLLDQELFEIRLGLRLAS